MSRSRYYPRNSTVLSDRFTRGLLAGFIAAVPVIAFNIISKYLFATISYADFAGTMILGHLPEKLLEILFAIGGELFFISFLGGIFALITPGLTSKNLLFKGWFFSCLVWFSSYALTVLFKVPGISVIAFKTALSNFLGASLWGVLLAYTLSWLDRKIKS